MVRNKWRGGWRSAKTDREERWIWSGREERKLRQKSGGSSFEWSLSSSGGKTTIRFLYDVHACSHRQKHMHTHTDKNTCAHTHTHTHTYTSACLPFHSLPHQSLLFFHPLPSSFSLLFPLSFLFFNSCMWWSDLLVLHITFLFIRDHEGVAIFNRIIHCSQLFICSRSINGMELVVSWKCEVLPSHQTMF